MSIKIDDKLKSELKEFNEWIQKRNPAWVNENQEIILTTLSLLINPKFRTRVQALRQDYKAPREWYTVRGNDDFYDEWWEWHEQNNYQYPYYHSDNRIINLCREFKVNPKRYGSFILDYLYFGNVYPLRVPNFEYFNAQGEYKYKARIELDYGEEREDNYTPYPQRAYIRFFKDTTKNQLIRFIKNKENWKNIATIKQGISIYPHRKKYGRFKRDIKIYLLDLLGYNAAGILNELAKDVKTDRNLTEEEESYYLDEPAIRQIVKDVKEKIKTVSE